MRVIVCAYKLYSLTGTSNDTHRVAVATRYIINYISNLYVSGRCRAPLP